MRLLVGRCIGSHRLDWEDPDDEGERDADYFRECAYCGIQIDLCWECRSHVFLCERCFRAQKSYGKDKARAMGAARERRRVRARRRRLLERRSA